MAKEYKKLYKRSSIDVEYIDVSEKQEIEAKKIEDATVYKKQILPNFKDLSKQDITKKILHKSVRDVVKYSNELEDIVNEHFKEDVMDIPVVALLTLDAILKQLQGKTTVPYTVLMDNAYGKAIEQPKEESNTPVIIDASEMKLSDISTEKLQKELRKRIEESKVIVEE